jgi:hypothetical protein
MKVGLSNHQSVCVPLNNVLTAWYIFMKSGMEVMPFKGTSMQYYLIPYLQPFKNG